MGSKNDISEKIKNRINLKNVLLYTNATPIKFKDSLGYRCLYCSKQFPEPIDLKRHTLNEHNDDDLIKQVSQRFCEQVIKLDITLLNCALCDTDFNQLNDLMAHLKCKHSKIIYTDVKNWILPFKFDSSELRCCICGTTFATFKLLLEHTNKHYPNYVCEVCGVGYITDTLRRRHLKRHGDGEYKCDQCDKVFTSAQNRILHVRRTHLGLTKRNICHFCDERFADYWRKIDHMVKEHGLPPVVLKCQACDRTFTNQRKLNKHTKKDHLLERKHKCTECEMRFFGKNSLQKHMTKHTGLRQYQCDVCLKFYGRKQTLKEHMRIHANDRRFSCVHCGQAFVQKCSWKSHMKSKHGEDIS